MYADVRDIALIKKQRGADMLNEKKSAARLQISKIMHEKKRMQAELDEHRYHFERTVERRTNHLLKRIALLESCNATLCDKLALAQKEVLALKQQTAPVLQKKETEQKGRAIQLFGINDQVQKKKIGLGELEERVGRVSAH